MPLDADLLAATLDARARLAQAQQAVDVARADYEHAVRRLHGAGAGTGAGAGANLREIARALGISHQRVHQIVDAGVVRRRRRRRSSDPAVFACSFCATPQAQAGKLVAGPQVFICDRCIRLASTVVATEAGAENDLVRLEPVAPGGPGCSFCSKTDNQVTALVGTADERICSECLELTLEILAEEPVT